VTSVYARCPKDNWLLLDLRKPSENQRGLSRKDLFGEISERLLWVIAWNLLETPLGLDKFFPKEVVEKSIAFAGERLERGHLGGRFF